MEYNIYANTYTCVHGTEKVEAAWLGGKGESGQDLRTRGKARDNLSNRTAGLGIHVNNRSTAQPKRR